MNNPWDFFKYIYVISLPNMSHRRNRIAEILRTIGCSNFAFFDAVNGKKHPTLRQDYIQREIIHETSTKTDGGLGCFASHRAIWETVYNTIDSKEPFWTLIFEDDAYFHKDIPVETLGEYIKSIPKDALFIKFGHTNTSPNAHMRHLVKNDYWMIPEPERQTTFGLYCYALRSDLLSKLLSIKNISRPIDYIYPTVGIYLARDLYNNQVYENTNATFIITQKDQHGIVFSGEDGSTTRG